MPIINVATGLTEYDINGKCSVMFNPTDVAFVEKIFSAFNGMDEKTEEYARKIAEETDNAKAFELARQKDAEMREIINGIFGCDVCGPVFGSINVYAQADGLPLWANLLLAIIDEMDDAFAREKKAADPRIKKYTDKFKRK